MHIARAHDDSNDADVTIVALTSAEAMQLIHSLSGQLVDPTRGRKEFFAVGQYFSVQVSDDVPLQKKRKE